MFFNQYRSSCMGTYLYYHLPAHRSRTFEEIPITCSSSSNDTKKNKKLLNSMPWSRVQIFLESGSRNLPVYTLCGHTSKSKFGCWNISEYSLDRAYTSQTAIFVYFIVVCVYNLIIIQDLSQQFYSRIIVLVLIIVCIWYYHNRSYIFMIIALDLFQWYYLYHNCSISSRSFMDKTYLYWDFKGFDYSVYLCFKTWIWP